MRIQLFRTSTTSTVRRCGSEAHSSPPEVQATGSAAPVRRRAGRLSRSPAGLTWTVLRRALLLVAGVAVLLGGAAVVGQEVVLEKNSAGCLADRAPGPPTNLKATPKDGRVILTWDPPAGGACVDAYVVNVVDSTLRSGRPTQSTSTGARKVVIEGLTNGRLYSFAVLAYSGKFLTGGIAQVTSSPTDLCSLSEAPGQPTNLRVQTGQDWARLCWDGVQNDACVDQYRVSAMLLDGPSFRSSSDGKISRGGCANITGLISGARYQFTVVPASNRHGNGSPASVTAVVGASLASARQNGWSCRAVDGCAPNRGGLCNVGGGCAGAARRGDCRVPALYDVDWVNKQVTQWCGAQCGCELGPLHGGGPGSGPGSGSGPGGLLMGLPRRLDNNDDDQLEWATVPAAGGSRGFGFGASSLDRSSLPASSSSSPSASFQSSSASPLGGNTLTLGLPAGGNAFGTVGPTGSAGGTGGSSLVQRTVPSSLNGGLGVGLGAGLGGGLGAATATGLASGGPLVVDWSAARPGQFVAGLAQDMVGSGVVGEAMGKVAAQVVSNQVNSVLQAMWGPPDNTGRAGRRLLS